MTIYRMCPRCGVDFSSTQFETGFAVCSCGWADPTPSLRARKLAEKRTIRNMILGSVVLVAAYAHMVNWGNYSLEIPLVKIQELTGTLSPAGYLELAGVCTSLGKYDCAKNSDLELYENRGDLRGLQELQKLQLRLGETQNAMSTSARYFQAGGNNTEVALNYGRLLMNSGNTDAALKYFDLAVASAGELLPVQAMTEKVHLLIKLGRYEEAFNSIEAFYASAGNAKGYLNTEHEQLSDYMNKQAKSNGPGHGHPKNKASGKHVA